MKSLVFLEHYHGAFEKGGLGVLGKAASLGEAAGVVLGEGASGIAAGAGAFGAAKVYVCEASELTAPLPQPRVDALATLVEKTGADAVLFARLRARLRRRVGSRRASRRGSELGPHRPRRSRTASSSASGRRSATRSLVDVGWKGGPKLGAGPRGHVRPGRVGRDGRGRVVRDVVLRLLDARRR